MTEPPLPADSHVHTEWSWDAVTGSMIESCRRALELGVPALAFTEHVDLTPWQLPEAVRTEDLPDHFRVLLRADGVLEPPALDVVGYLGAVAECRDRFPALRILTGVELSEPHWHRDATSRLVGSGELERVLGSVHAVPVPNGAAEVGTVDRPALEVVRDYLREAHELAASTVDFEVLAHVDYPWRYEHIAEAVRTADVEDELRAVLAALAGAGRVLEINTRSTPYAEIVQWWHQAGGRAVSFGSDAHDPADVARGFRAASDLAAASGFVAGRSAVDFFLRA